MAENTWEAVALPLLEYVAEHGGQFAVLSVGDIADGIGIDPEVAARELDRLSSAGFLAGGVEKFLGGDVRPWHLEPSDLGERGLRAVRSWPSEDPYEALIEALDKRITTAPDSQTRTRLQALKSAAGDVGKATLSALLAELAKGTFHF